MIPLRDVVASFTVRINSESLPWALRSVQLAHPQLFCDIRNYVSLSYGTDNDYISQLHAANQRLLSHVTLCLIECNK